MEAAVAAVHVPDSVIDVLTSLRDYLQDKCEPPIYVSDRRFMKAINLLQVAAYADNREEVGHALQATYSCLQLSVLTGCTPVPAVHLPFVETAAVQHAVKFSWAVPPCQQQVLKPPFILVCRCMSTTACC